MSERAPRWVRAVALIAVAVPILACGELTIVNSSNQTAYVLAVMGDRATSSVRTLKPGESTGMSTDDNTKYSVVVVPPKDQEELGRKMDQYVALHKRFHARNPEDDAFALKDQMTALAKEITKLRSPVGSGGCSGKVPEGGTSVATLTLDSGTGQLKVGCKDTPPKKETQ